MSLCKWALVFVIRPLVFGFWSNVVLAASKLLTVAKGQRAKAKNQRQKTKIYHSSLLALYFGKPSTRLSNANHKLQL
jgi:hypothetical protein